MKPCCEKYLNEQFGGDADVVSEIYKEYVSSIADKMKELKANLAAAAWDPLDKTAHAIKGNALAAGDSEMAETAISLRNEAKLKDAESASALVAKMESLASLL